MFPNAGTLCTLASRQTLNDKMTPGMEGDGVWMELDSHYKIFSMKMLGSNGLDTEYVSTSIYSTYTQ